MILICTTALSLTITTEFRYIFVRLDKNLNHTIYNVYLRLFTIRAVIAN